MEAEVMSDVTIENQGSMFLFRLESDVARAWWEENVGSQGRQWSGNGCALRPRLAAAVAQAMEEAGLEVE
jgi:hypothetical protein